MQVIMELSRWLIGIYRYGYRRVKLPSIWTYTQIFPSIPQAPNPNGFDVKIFGLFAAEVVCFWGGEYAVLNIKIACRVYLKDPVADVLGLLAGKRGHHHNLVRISAEEMTIEDIDPLRGHGSRLME